MKRTSVFVIIGFLAGTSMNTELRCLLVVRLTKIKEIVNRHCAPKTRWQIPSQDFACCPFFSSRW
jgi:hypothetical protein